MYTVFMGVIGIAFGSFFNVLIDRIPNGESIVRGRSHCDHCRQTLAWYELVPVLSWGIQSGRCRRCRRRISVQYPLVEAAAAALFIWVAASYPPPDPVTAIWLVETAGRYIQVSALLVLFVTDLKYQLLPDVMVLVLLAGTACTNITASAGMLLVLLGTGISAGSAFYALWLVTRKKGMGLGDAKLAAVLGCMLGVPHIFVALYTAFLTGATYGVILMIAGRAGMKSRVAFGPFLITGAVVAHRWGHQILHYWGFI